MSDEQTSGRRSLQNTLADFRAHAVGDLLILQQFSEKSSLGFGWADTDGSVIYANSSLCGFLGEDPKAIQGKNIRSFYPPEDLLRLEKSILPEVMGNGSWTGELSLRAEEGKSLPTLHDMFVIPSTRGLPLYIALVITDISERIRAEHILKESEEKFRTISEQSLMGIVIIQNGLVKYANDAVIQMFGYPREEVQKWKFEEFAKTIHPGDMAFVMEQYRKKQKGDADVKTRYRYRSITASGNVSWLELWSRTITFQEGPAVFINLIDVTDQVRSMESLIESEEKFRTITEGSVLCAVIMQDGVIKYANKAIADLSGYPVDDIMEWKSDEFLKTIHPEDLPLVREQISRKLSGSADVQESYPLRIINRTGKIRWVDLYSRALSLDGRRAIFVTMADVTQKREAEQSLRESEEQYRKLVESSHDVIFQMDLNGTLQFVNEAFTSVLGYSVVESLGRNGLELLHSDSVEGMKHSLSQARLGIRTKNLECRIRADNGGYVHFAVNAAPAADKHGKINGITGVARDITELILIRHQIEESLKEKDVLLQEIHHRVKNNMQVITSLLKLQAGKTDDEGVKKIFHESQNRIIAMSLIHETLYQSDDISRLSCSSYISKLVSSLFQAYSIDNKKITYQVDTEDEVLSVDDAIPVGLIINELVSNSLKHGYPEGKPGEIRIKTRSLADGRFELDVRDDGLGFVPVSDFKKSKTLGLQLVHTLAEVQLGGTLEHEHTAGTRYTIRFFPKKTGKPGRQQS